MPEEENPRTYSSLQPLPHLVLSGPKKAPSQYWLDPEFLCQLSPEYRKKVQLLFLNFKFEAF